MNNLINRAIEPYIVKALFAGKIIIIYGARQVGKTTLVKKIQAQNQIDSLYLNCDEPDVARKLSDKTSTELKDLFGNKKLIIIDEAQRIKNIGLTLKLAIDTFPEIQIIATGSSSFDLANKVNEPLTGRKVEFMLPPLSLREIADQTSTTETERRLNKWLIFGLYPGLVTAQENLNNKLKELADSYLYKDVLKFKNIRKHEVLEKLLQALALQIGSEVSYTELSSLVGIDKKTVADYVNILEQAFVIFSLKPFSRNLRNELKKRRKIYFYDNGIRNALINNFNEPQLRNDIGCLWENFIITERFKASWNKGRYAPQAYFWRATDGKEIDYLEDNNGLLAAFEFKWSNTKEIKPPKLFTETYHAQVTKINPANFWQFI